MRVVLDTNVLISATLIRGGNEDRILRAWRHGAFELVLSPPILQELGRVLFYPRIRQARWMTDEDAIALLQLIAEESVVVPGRLTVTASRDPEDDKFLAAAIEAGAEYVVTGDNDLLDLGTYRRIGVMRPAAFLGLLRGRERRR